VTAFVGAATFTSTITLGSIILGIVVGAAGLSAFFYGVRWKSAWQVASAQAEELRRALDDERNRAERLEERLDEAVKQLALSLQQLADAKEAIERLSALPNLERVVKLMADTAERAEHRAQQRLAGALDQLAQRAAETERRAEERHRLMINLLEMVAERLGPDPNGD
jgi:hypothetical protein